MQVPNPPARGEVVEKTTGLMTRPWLAWFDFFSALFAGDPDKCRVRWGNGSPEHVVAAPVGSSYFRKDGGAGTTFYVKESGTGDTGWVGK